MSVYRIASRYAKSLIELAQEQNKLERILDDIKSFNGLLKNRDLYMLFKSPIVHVDRKQKIISKIFEGKYDELTIAFIRILIAKGREQYLPEVAAEFIHQYKVIKHISTVKLITATPLSKEMIKKIHDQLQANKATDLEVEIVTEVRPGLIGGFIIQFDEKVYDASVSHKLEKLKKNFEGNIYVSQIRSI
jgi:F-type H+-transporting ATPase subunit delta